MDDLTYEDIFGQIREIDTSIYCVVESLSEDSGPLTLDLELQHLLDVLQVASDNIYRHVQERKRY